MQFLTPGFFSAVRSFFYASISMVISDLNSTMKRSAKIVVLSRSFLTGALSDSVMSAF